MRDVFLQLLRRYAPGAVQTGNTTARGVGGEEFRLVRMSYGWELMGVKRAIEY
jgi:hypothetical protein